MKIRLVSFTLFGLFMTLLAGTSHAYTNPNHFVDSQWNLQDPTGYNSIEVDITPQVEESTTTDGYYFANTVYFRNYTGSNFGGAYAGMQTNGYDGTSYIGKMAIFSVWDVSNGVAESGGSGTSFGGEGSGYSVRLPFNWQVGTTYRLKIYIDQDAASSDRLWGASLTNLSTGAVTRIGRIYVPVARGKIYGPVTFHERYMGATDCGSIKKSQVRFSNMTANDGAFKATSWSHYGKSQVPECPGLVWLQDDSGGFMSGVGTPKPAAAVTPTTPQPVTPTVKPVVPKTVDPPTTQTPTTLPTIDPTPTPTTTHASPKKIAPSSSKMPLILAGVTIPALGLGTGAFFGVKHYRKRKLQALLKKHFPFDPDIHRY